ncbi:MAG: DUF3014 domain-containing protein [Acidobacteria bacterium]|nr:DUF3014 domain-containing protein [Acidobacteriota bacterium]MBU4307851.1 DUF3014 domain-containing protein [Acidobacteriota bacterium]MCG2810875.1 DUF3014 domain-containing protein [Candidatus Aminicenantes bacterium]
MPAYQKIIWIGLGVTVIAILALGYFMFLAPQSPQKTPVLPEPSALLKAQEAAAPAVEEADDPNITPLDLDLEQSDGSVRELVAAADVPDAWRQWSQQKDLVRMAVTAVDNIANGLSPAAQLPFLAPVDKFSAIEKNGAFILDPRSFRRYDHMSNAFVSVSVKIWITWYKTLRPTLEKAFKELGYPGITFSQRLQQAIEQLLQVPFIEKDIELEKKVLSFAFADVNLENLNPAQKQLLRMGPGNAARIQKKLRELAAGLNKIR